MKKIKFSHSGFSIMEVMIAAGLLGIVTVGVMQITKNMTKSTKTQAQQVEFNQIQTQIQSLLRDEYSCESTFIGVSPTGSGTSISQVKRRKPDGTQAVVFQTGQIYGSSTSPIFLRAMALKNYNASTGMGEFYIEMNKGRKDFNTMTQPEKDTVLATSYGTAIVPRTIKVNLILDGSGKVKDCVSDKDDYTSGACGMINGDWSDKIKCKSISVQGNGVSPSITAETNLHVKSGLNVGSTLSGDPGNGNVTLSNDLDVKNKATVKSDTTITSGKLIFNDGDARINQQAGNNLYIENKAGTAGANIIAGKTGAARTTVTPTSVAINKNGTVGAGLALDVTGNTTITGSGSTSVTLKVGNADIQYNGTNLVLRKPTGGVVQYADGSTIEEVASQGFVNAQLGKALTGNTATLTTILSNLGTLVSGNPVQAISATTCGFYTNMVWNGTRCVDNRTTNCTGNNRVNGFNNGAINCQPVAELNTSCPAGQLLIGYQGNGVRNCANANNQIGAYVDGRINAVIAANNATNTCINKGGWFDAGSGGGLGVCRYTRGGCSLSYNNGCKARHNCSGCPGGWNCRRTGGCGTWGASDQTECYRTGQSDCWCALSADGRSCGGDNCGGCY